MSKLTVGKLKEALKGVPDELEVELWSDSGLDQCDDDNFEVVVEETYRHTYQLPEGKTYEDGTNKVDYFVIYANYREDED